jgi:hypothetical protein
VCADAAARGGRGVARDPRRHPEARAESAPIQRRPADPTTAAANTDAESGDSGRAPSQGGSAGSEKKPEPSRRGLAGFPPVGKPSKLPPTLAVPSPIHRKSSGRPGTTRSSATRSFSFATWLCSAKLAPPTVMDHHQQPVSWPRTIRRRPFRVSNYSAPPPVQRPAPPTPSTPHLTLPCPGFFQLSKAVQIGITCLRFNITPEIAELTHRPAHASTTRPAEYR